MTLKKKFKIHLLIYYSIYLFFNSCVTTENKLITKQTLKIPKKITIAIIDFKIPNNETNQFREIIHEFWLKIFKTSAI